MVCLKCLLNKAPINLYYKLDNMMKVDNHGRSTHDYMCSTA